MSGKEGGVSKWRFHFQRSDAFVLDDAMPSYDATIRQQQVKTPVIFSRARVRLFVGRRDARGARGWGGDAMNCEIHQLSPLRCERISGEGGTPRGVAHRHLRSRARGGASAGR